MTPGESQMRYAALIFTAVLVLNIFIGCTPQESGASNPEGDAKQTDDVQKKGKEEKKSECTHTADTLKCVKYVRNYDADTITMEIPGLHPLLGKNAGIRVLGVDTPEIRTKNACEKKKAKHAKKVVEKILSKAKRIDLENISRGKFFRIVADVKADGKSLTKMLLEKNLAYPYDGGTKRKVDWCKPLQNAKK